MRQSTWRVLAFGALLGVMALPASAQVVIGGSSPSVEVNWAVLDGLGRQPTLADMLKADVPGADIRPAHQPKAAQGVQYRPYKAGAMPYGKVAKPAKAPKPAKLAEPKAKKSSVVPASARSERMAELVQASRSPAAAESKPVETNAAEVTPVEVPRASSQPPVPPKPVVTPVAEAPKPAAPAIIGPQIALPELPKPAAAPAAPPVQLAKAEPEPEPAPKAAEPNVEAKPEPVAPLPPTALTPPPLPAAKVEAPTQVASLAPAAAPTPVPAAAPVSAPAPAVPSPRGGDTLTVPFAAESARLSDSSHGDLDRLVKRMQKDEGLGLQLLAYADGDDANASKARRLSLSRALEVRKYLMDQGLRSTRIEVRALGNKLEGSGPADRVDAVLVTR